MYVSGGIVSWRRVNIIVDHTCAPAASSPALLLSR